MDRRKFIAVGAAALLAGCDSQNDGTETPGDDGTPGGADGTEGNSGDGNAPANTGSPTPDPTLTPGGDFEADVTFDSCSSVTVDAENYTHVFLSLAGGDVNEFEEGYSGSNTFEGDGVINTVEVYGESGTYSAPNPDASECREEEE